MSENDKLIFFTAHADDEIKKEEADNNNFWKIIIADDSEEVHTITRLVLKDFSFNNNKLNILSAYSGEETLKLITKHPDTALILLDVVMEEEDSGLQVVRKIREVLNNKIVQIILNTGQPGQAPEQEIITKYDINDYKNKTDFSAKKLVTSVTASLRSYSFANSLNQANIKLNGYKNHLEDLVKQRTSDLEITNKQLIHQIEERKLADLKLTKLNMILNNILTSSPIGIGMMENFQLQWINPAMLALFDIADSPLDKKYKFSNFFALPKEFEKIMLSIRSEKNREKILKFDTVLKRYDKTQFFGHLMVSYIDKQKSDSAEQIIITISDLTWRKQAEQDKIHQERMQGVIEMAGGICHELNQPLQYVSGMSELLLLDINTNDSAFKTVSKIKNQIEKMGKITRKLMNITRYKTKEYIKGTTIIDIEQASKNDKLI